jgi:hypothetical protein
MTYFINIDQKAKAMIPNSGTNEEWDALNQEIIDVQKQFQNHLTAVKKKLG